MTNNLKFYGAIREVLPQQTGTSKAGKQWWSQSIIVDETDTQYPQTAVFTLFGKSLNEDNVRQMVQGNQVTVSFNLSTREWADKDGNQRFSTELQAWRIEAGNTIDGVRQPADDTPFTPTFAPASTGYAAQPATPVAEPIVAPTADTDSDMPF